MRLLGLFAFTGLVSVALDFRWPMRMVFLNTFIGVLAVKVIAERYDFSVFKTGRMLMLHCLLNLLFLGLQHFNHDPLFMKFYEEKAGMMWMPWMLGASAVLCVPFFMRVNPCYVLAAVAVAMASHSKSCIAVGLIAGFIGTGARLRWKWLGLMMVALLAYIYFADFNFDLTRADVWRKAFAFWHSPFWGNGIGSWPHEGFLKFNGATPEHWRWAHNDLLQLLFEQGIFGLGAGLLLLTRLISKDPFKRSLLASVVLLSMFHPIFRFGKFLGLLVLIIAWLIPKNERVSLYAGSPNTI